MTADLAAADQEKARQRERLRVMQHSAATYWLAVLTADLIRSFIGYAVLHALFGVVKRVRAWRSR